MLFRVTSLYHNILPPSLPTTKGARVTPTPLYTTPVPPPQNAMRPPGFHPRAAYTPQPTRPPQPSIAHLESMMVQFLAVQTKTNEAVTASVTQLTSKFDAMATHHKAMDTKIAQIAQQVSHLS